MRELAAAEKAYKAAQAISRWPNGTRTTALPPPRLASMPLALPSRKNAGKPALTFKAQVARPRPN